MPGYGQFCPVAKAMEILDGRWTMLVVRELLLGSTHFNELRRGLPRMSPALLSKRLHTLERVGVVERTGPPSRSAYTLTTKGRELSTVVDALGAWGVRWIGELGEQDLDPHLLMWDMRRTIPVARWPRSRTVLAVEFADTPVRTSRWWIVVAGDDVDVCDFDPGHATTATVRTTLRALTAVWRGDLTWATALRSGAVAVEGEPAARRQVPERLGQSVLSAVPRPTGLAG